LDDDGNNEDHHHLMGGDIGSLEHGFLQGKRGFDDVMTGATTAAGGRDEDEDILGMLSKPVEVVIANKVFFDFYYDFVFNLFCRQRIYYLSIQFLEFKCWIEDVDTVTPHATTIRSRIKSPFSTTTPGSWSTERMERKGEGTERTRISTDSTRKQFF
jgi:hypothetical protein